MVSYKRLNPENVQFSGALLSEEHHRPFQEDVEVPQPDNASLLPRRLSCSITKAVLILGCLLLLLFGGWLLHTIYWLWSTSSQAHRAPAPGQASGPVLQAELNNTVITARSNACSIIPEGWRFDCYPERGVVVNRELCEARNCCFIPASSSARGKSRKNGIPWCFYPPDFPSYSLVSLNDTSIGLKGTLVKDVKTYYPGDILTLEMEIRHETDTRLHVRITDPSSSRFEVPISVPTAAKKAENPQYIIELSKQPFGLVVKRRSTGTVLLNTTVAPLFYADQFLQFSTTLPTRFIYGLGEHRSNFLHSVQWNTLTMWARDVPPMEQTNLYGAHPFYLVMENGGDAHGFFLLNSNAMDVVLQPGPALTWRTIGGILDFYVFLGPDPGSVIEQYVDVIGHPAMPIYWALGYHLCRWGYKTSNATWEVVKNMRNNGIPQDVQWNDIDYMDQAKDFTFDPANFNTLPDLVRDLHAHNQTYVMILDPGISSTQPEGSYWPFDEGLKRGVFIKDAEGKTLIGKVWPGPTAFPDFSNEVTHEWWYENLKRFHEKVPFDGLWIVSMLTFNLLGIPLVGADICGFSEEPQEELCVRWTQLGAFYPFARNHNSLDMEPQDPTVFSPLARTAMKQALLLRYSFFPFLYTLFHHAHVKGHTVARPLMFEFPKDIKTYGIDKQFLWGRSLLVTPVLEPRVDHVDGYFPEGLWYDYYTGDSVSSKGEKFHLSAPLDKINLHLRQGSVIPTQEPKLTLWVSSGQPLHLVSALSDDGSASGDLFWDDGETIDTYETDQYTYVLFNISQNVMTSHVLHSDQEGSFITIDSTSFYGVREKPSRVLVNSKEVPFFYRENQVLSVANLGLSLIQNFTISWM
ncbi:hypothetical protein CRENBAI_026830 [Crenichthys baileyi]|uniref:P-type domain-containing protein n=1 Tax=Crenichthys baileyi TaxID=28760 RepID=A0AAV9QRG1_9TELE